MTKILLFIAAITIMPLHAMDDTLPPCNVVCPHAQMLSLFSSLNNKDKILSYCVNVDLQKANNCYPNKYTELFEQHPSLMRGTISDSALVSLIPNCINRPLLMNIPKEVATTLTAVKLALKKSKICVSLGSASTKATTTELHPALPLACIYAQNKFKCKNILIKSTKSLPLSTSPEKEFHSSYTTDIFVGEFGKNVSIGLPEGKEYNDYNLIIYSIAIDEFSILPTKTLNAIAEETSSARAQDSILTQTISAIQLSNESVNTNKSINNIDVLSILQQLNALENLQTILETIRIQLKPAKVPTVITFDTKNICNSAAAANVIIAELTK